MLSFPDVSAISYRALSEINCLSSTTLDLEIFIKFENQKLR
jgi:hypothetical protein